MDVIQHDHAAVQLETLVLLTIAEGVRRDLPAVMAVEQVITALDCQGEVIGPCVQVHWYAA